jgi:hypothetical protein
LQVAHKRRAKASANAVASVTGRSHRKAGSISSPSPGCHLAHPAAGR